jgi:hypothetical protein
MTSTTETTSQKDSFMEPPHRDPDPMLFGTSQALIDESRRARAALDAAWSGHVRRLLETHGDWLSLLSEASARVGARGRVMSGGAPRAVDELF